MSILDGFYAQETGAEELLASLKHHIDTASSEIGGDAADLLAAVAEGFSFADIMGFGEDHKEALFQFGCRFMVTNNLDQAERIFVMLALLDPLEARAPYGLGIIAQTRKELHKAAQFFMQFIILDATNPKGYLRLGECLLAANEHQEAESAFLTAKKLAESGHGNQSDADEAIKQLNNITN